MKVCSRCRENKNLSEFYVDSRYRLGVTSFCRLCKKETSHIIKQRYKVLPKPVLISKKCSSCQEVKPVSEFWRTRAAKDGYQTRCKPCHENAALHTRSKPETILKVRLRQYGMSLEDLEHLLQSQQGRCAICNEEFVKPVIDHDHETGIVRELLCYRCNIWLSGIESPGFAEKAQAYIAKHKNTPGRFKIATYAMRSRKRQKATEKVLRHA